MTDENEDDIDPTEQGDLNLDLAELAIADDGGKRFDEYIVRRATKIAAKIVREQIEGTLTEASQSYRVTNQFKDLGDPESEFAKAVLSEKTNLNKDPMYKGMGEAAMTELAAHRVENQYLRDGKKRTLTPEPKNDEDRAAAIRRDINPRFVNQGLRMGLTKKEIQEAYSDKGVKGWRPG